MLSCRNESKGYFPAAWKRCISTLYWRYLLSPNSLILLNLSEFPGHLHFWGRTFRQVSITPHYGGEQQVSLLPSLISRTLSLLCAFNLALTPRLVLLLFKAGEEASKRR